MLRYVVITTIVGLIIAVAYMFKTVRSYEAAAERVNSPIFESGVEFPVQFTGGKFADSRWTILAEDPENDGGNPLRADGKTLSYVYDTESDTLWFKFELYNSINVNFPSATLQLDLDHNQETGRAWTGDNTGFIMDGRVFIGPKRYGDVYRGYNGAVGKQGVVDFYIDIPSNTYYLGIARRDLSHSSDTLNVVGSVGEVALWNDDLPNEGYATIRVPADTAAAE